MNRHPPPPPERPDPPDQGAHLEPPAPWAPPPAPEVSPALRGVIDRSLLALGDLFDGEELELGRRFLLTLASTHPRFSDWLAQQESLHAAAPDEPSGPEEPDEPASPPLRVERGEPERSGTVRKRDRAALAAQVKKTGGRGGGR